MSIFCIYVKYNFLKIFIWSHLIYVFGYWTSAVELLPRANNEFFRMKVLPYRIGTYLVFKFPGYIVRACVFIVTLGWGDRHCNLLSKVECL
jgi:hypothetical protein